MENREEEAPVSFFFINTMRCFKNITDIKNIAGEMKKIIGKESFSAFFYSGEEYTEWAIKVAMSCVSFKEGMLFKDEHLSCTTEWMKNFSQKKTEKTAVLAAVRNIKDGNEKIIHCPPFSIAMYEIIRGELKLKII
jgi:hypothetical protein